MCACACLGARERSERVARAAQPTSPALPPTCIKTVTYFYGYRRKKEKIFYNDFISYKGLLMDPVNCLEHEHTDYSKYDALLEVTDY